MDHSNAAISASPKDDNNAYRTAFKALKNVRNFSELMSRNPKKNVKDETREEAVVITLNPNEANGGNENPHSTSLYFREREKQHLETFGCETKGNCCPVFGVNPPNEWKIYDFVFPAGSFCFSIG